MLLVEGDTVQLLDGGDGLFGGLVLDKSEPAIISITLNFEPASRMPNTHPSVIFLSVSGIKTASSEVWPTVLSFLNRNLISFCLLSSGTTGRPSITTNVSRPSSSLTSYCALRSIGAWLESLKRGKALKSV